MKRLRETQANSPLMKNVRALLDAEPALPDSRDRMLRVRAALDRPRARGGLLRVPAFAAAVAVALFGASAFAAVRIYEAIDRPAAQPAPAGEPQHAARKGRRAHKRSAAQPLPETTAVQPQAAPVQTAPPVAEPVRAVSPRAPSARAVVDHEPVRTPRVRDGARRLHGDGARSQAKREAEASAPEQALATPPAAASDSELVHRAVKALRRDGDPALAARLLQEHRARTPEGPLAEEALSLQIEAALALRSPRAAALAREYLARYPGGRYASVAARALQEAPP
jgi:hypothetical protein